MVLCELWTVNAKDEVSFKSQDLIGASALSSSIWKDEEDIDGCFAIFSDLSIRTNGNYRLKFTLYDINE